MRTLLSLVAFVAFSTGLTAQRVNAAHYYGTATQSSTNGAMVASRANDHSHSGNNNLCCNGTPWPNLPSIACTANLPLSWWQCSLSFPYPIEEILIWNRADADVERLSNFRVELFLAGNLLFTQDFFTNGGHVPAAGHVRVLPGDAPLTVDLCRITKIGPSPTGGHHLQLAEVEMWGTPAPTLLGGPTYRLTNVARYGTASTSHIGIGSPGPAVLIDGDSSGWAPSGSTFWTLSFPGSWVRVDFPAPVTVRRVSLYNRVDALMERMSRYRVRLFNGPTAVATWALETTTMPALGWHRDVPGTTTQATHILIESFGQGATLEEIVQLAEVEVWAMNFNLQILGEALPYGAPCEATSGGPRTRYVGTGAPRLNTGFATHVSNTLPIGAGVYGAILITGFQATSAYGQNLPFVFGAPLPGCTLLASPDVLLFGSSATPDIAFPIGVPNNFSLLNVRLWQQGVILDPATPYLDDIVLSNGLRLTIGL